MSDVTACSSESALYSVVEVNMMTCSEKRDLRDIFMNIEVLAWIDSSVYAEYNGASFKEKY